MTVDRKVHLTTLTPLRGMAAVFVVIFHSNLLLMPMFPWGSVRFVGNSWIWVDFFFILSGFIISYAYGDVFRADGLRAHYLTYVGARFARIYPLHFLTLMWSFGCALLIRHYAASLHPLYDAMYSPSALPAAMLLVHSLHLYTTPPLNTPSWSLSTEWWVYLLYPLVFGVFFRVGRIGRVVCFLCIAGAYVAIKYWLGPISSARFGVGVPKLNVVSDFGVVRSAVGFLLGMFVQELYQKGVGRAVLGRSVCFGALLLATLGLLSTAVQDLVFVVALFPLIILAAAYNDSWMKRLLAFPVFQRLGDWSFAIYMTHVPILQSFTIFLVQRNPSWFADFPPRRPPDYTMGVVLCCALLVSTIAVSSVAYRFFEVPARAALNRFWLRLSTHNVPAPGE